MIGRLLSDWLTIMKELFDLHQKTALVTGGYGHLGRSFVFTLREAGAKVFVGGRERARFRKVFGGGEDGIEFIGMDVADENSILSALSGIERDAGGLDILINNAVWQVRAKPEEMSPADFEEGINGGLFSVYRSIHYAIPLLKKSRQGRVINIASMYGVVVPDLTIYRDRENYLNPPNYGVAKAGVIHLTKYYAMVLAPYGICVNAISPGAFPSEGVQQDREFLARLEKKNPMGRIGTPDELRGALLLLASKASSYLTGQNIVIDGGWTIP